MDVYTFGVTPNLATNILAHAHPEWEVVCYFEGEGKLTIGDTSVDFEPGMIVCQPPNVHHYESSPGGFRNYYFHSPGFAPPNTSGISVYRDNADSDYLALMRMAYKMYILDTERSRLALGQLVRVLYEYLSMWEALNITVSRNAEAVKNLIDGCYSDPGFRLTEELSRSGYCPDHIRRCFRRAYGLTPADYLLELRVRHAKLLLEGADKDTHVTIGDICAASGFGNRFYFSRVYKKVTGETPSETLERGNVVLCVPENDSVCLQ